MPKGVTMNKEPQGLVKTITMKEIMQGLGIKAGDIVSVDSTLYHCNDIYDLVLPDNKYSSGIPNVILAMVSGKKKYTVYSVSAVYKYIPDFEVKKWQKTQKHNFKS